MPRGLPQRCFLGGLAISPHIQRTADDTAIDGQRTIIATIGTVKYAGQVVGRGRRTPPRSRKGGGVRRPRPTFSSTSLPVPSKPRVPSQRNNGNPNSLGQSPGPSRKGRRPFRLAACRQRPVAPHPATTSYDETLVAKSDRLLAPIPLLGRRNPMRDFPSHERGCHEIFY